jgi:hypothetical protein
MAGWSMNSELFPINGSLKTLGKILAFRSLLKENMFYVRPASDVLEVLEIFASMLSNRTWQNLPYLGTLDDCNSCSRPIQGLLPT